MTDALHHVRLELAREAGHPGGDHHEGYDLVAPLTAEGRLAAGPRTEPNAWRVRRFAGEETQAVGRLQHGPGGRWTLHFGDGPDEPAFHLGAEHLKAGEYVAIGDHTYRVAVVRAL